MKAVYSKNTSCSSKLSRTWLYWLSNRRSAALGALFECIESQSQITDILSIYEGLRKQRASSVVRASTAQRELLHLPDGDLQQGKVTPVTAQPLLDIGMLIQESLIERDRQLKGEEPCDRFPYTLADPQTELSLYHYDAYVEAQAAWDAYKAA